MKKFLNSPLTRISIGLAMLTLSIVLIADLLGLVPNPKKAELEARKTVAETLAVQVSQTLSQEQTGVAEQLLEALVDRNASVISAAVRKGISEGLVSYGNHGEKWKLKPYEDSTAEQVRVPIYRNNDKWGSVEMVFAPLGKKHGIGQGILYLSFYVFIAGFIAYRFFLKRALQELNPDAVIPERVSSALDTLSEGLLIVDTSGAIVFSNDAFAKKTGLDKKLLLGRNSCDLDWKLESGAITRKNLPWLSVLEGHELPEGLQIKLISTRKEELTFTINASPVLGEQDKIRGVLVTFDDITKLERTNQELLRTNQNLQNARDEVNRQNEELNFLATRDPLTNALNRRSLFQGFDLVFADAKNNHRDLCCIMVDIDHFKQVNDNYGHGVGDNVIKKLGKVLLDASRPTDLVGRYGGEEFCIVLPGTNIKTATALAETIRLEIKGLVNLDPDDELKITSSFGIADLSEGATDPAKLVDQADQALYQAKRSGRDQLAIWPCDENSKSLAKTIVTGNIDLILQDGNQNQEQADQAEYDPATPGISRIAAQANAGDNPLDGALDKDASNYSNNLLGNRELIADRIEQALKYSERHGTDVAVLAVNVDSLQKVNDTLGYRVGEKFIAAVAERLQSTLRSTDTIILAEHKEEMLFSIARSSTDELVIVLNDLVEDEIISNILKRIQKVFREPVETESMEFFLDLRIGISLAPKDGLSASVLIQNATSAMHQLIQSDDHNFFKFYDKETNSKLIKRMQLESELHRAIERGEMEVFYQPKVHLKSGEIDGFEALLRWNHSKLGTIMPDEFIPLAEQSGVIGQIGNWVLETACTQAKCWHDMGYNDLGIAINISPVEFKNMNFATSAIGTILSTGIDVSTVELEITETAMIQDFSSALKIIHELRDAGLSVSVDDFGVGYSSLSYLQKFPLQNVKIDRSFILDIVDNAHNGALVSAIVSMSHMLGISVIAEGVETMEHMRFLQDLGCDSIQGYLISKPMHYDNVVEFLEGEAQIRHMVTENQTGSNLLQFNQAGNMIGVLNELPIASGH